MRLLCGWLIGKNEIHSLRFLQNKEVKPKQDNKKYGPKSLRQLGLRTETLSPHKYCTTKQIKIWFEGPNCCISRNRDPWLTHKANLKGTILKVTMIPRLGFGCVLTLQSKPAPTQSIYHLIVSSLPECHCPAFKDMISKFGCRQNSFLHCKHMYFIFVKVSNVDPES
jgi:hypothetical protein